MIIVRASDVNKCKRQYWLEKEFEPDRAVAQRVGERLELLQKIHDYFRDRIVDGMKERQIELQIDDIIVTGHIDGVREGRLCEVKTTFLTGSPEIKENWKYQVALYYAGVWNDTKRRVADELPDVAEIWVCDRETATKEKIEIRITDELIEEAKENITKLAKDKEWAMRQWPPFPPSHCRFWCPYASRCLREVRVEERNEIAKEYYETYLQLKELEDKAERLKGLLKLMGPARYAGGIVVFEKTQKKLDWNKLKRDVDLSRYYVEEKTIVVQVRR